MTLGETPASTRQFLAPPLSLLPALVQLRQPRASREIASATTDESRRRLAPGAAQDAVAKLALRRDPDRTLILRQGNGSEYAAHSLIPHCSGLGIIVVNRGLKDIV